MQNGSAGSDSDGLDQSNPPPSDAQPPQGNQGENDGRETLSPSLHRIAVALAVVVLTADVLFWETGGFGLSVPLFAGILCAAVLFLSANKRPHAKAMCLFAIGALPAIEYLQPLSITFLFVLTSMAIAYARSPARSPLASVLPGLAQLWHLPKSWCLMPFEIVQSAMRVKEKSPNHSQLLIRLKNDWAFPIGGALVIGGLLLSANPVLWDFVMYSNVPTVWLSRVMFWLGVAILSWPLLQGRDHAPISIPKTTVPMFNMGLNARSVLRALWVFNLLIGLQSVLDVAILFGGAELPTGMSYAQYAHRGAYPLLAMALLAGGFALSARPFINGTRLIRPLLFLWIAQNVIVCMSALLRLDLYIDVYGLTYLRIYAQVWMILVAIGLTLTFWQILRGHSNAWLLLRTLMLGVGVLYAACFVNIAKVIVDHNMALPEPDYAYLCQLGPLSGLKNHDRHKHLPPNCFARYNTDVAIQNWQNWDFRTWRYLGAD